jgi:hypothetical protein
VGVGTPTSVLSAIARSVTSFSSIGNLPQHSRPAARFMFAIQPGKLAEPQDRRIKRFLRFAAGST